jgi:hypothetical protein
MKTMKKQSKRAGMSASLAAMMGVVIGLIAGVSLSHGSVPAESLLKAEPAAIATPSDRAVTEAVAAKDVCDSQLD